MIGVIASFAVIFLATFYLFEWFKKRMADKLEKERRDTDFEMSRHQQQYDEKILLDALQRLHALEGLTTLKAEVDEWVKLIQYDLEEEQFEHKNAALHMVFLGNPGTGKTTVARIIADIYKGLGILDKGHLVEADRSALVAQYIGHTAVQTKAKIESAFGGVLFIDEAYNLIGRGNQDFGIEAIDTLLKMMEDFRGEFIVIVAGYEQEMMQFLASNPGLKSRFDKVFYFEDHQTSELLKVCLEQFSIDKKILTQEAFQILETYIKHLSDHRGKGFGNAREIRKIVAEVLKNQKLRLFKIPKDDRTDEMKSQIILDDVAEFKEVEVKYRKQIGYRK